jgi:hypothetical protein
MPHLCNGHEGVMSCDGWDGALELGENFWHISHAAMTFDTSSMIEGQYKPCLNTIDVRALDPM